MNLRTLSLTGLTLLGTAGAHAQSPPSGPASPAAPATPVSASPIPGIRPGSVAPPAMQSAAPGLAGYTDDVLFGEVWKRPGLTPRDRSLIVVSALVAAGRSAQLAGHVGRALDNGVSPAEISGIVIQMAFYEGWPVAVSAVAVVDEVFKRRGVDRATLLAAREGLAPAPADDAARVQAVARTVRPVAPGLAELTDRVLFGDVWRRTDLSPRDRALATVAGMVAAGDGAALGEQIPNALRLGVTPEQMGEALTHLAFYAGWPKATVGVAVLERVRAETASAGLPLVVTRFGSSPGVGPAEHFTGSVKVDTPFKGSAPARIGGARVTFEAGARTNWHSHPLGQTLIVTAGHGLVQREGGPVEAIGPGDTVWIPPGVRHWHGASPTEAMTHVAIVEALDGKTVDWFEPVPDGVYRTPPR